LSIGWGTSSVRVYAAEAWVSLAPRFAAEHATIVDNIDAILNDPVPAVRLQAARNLQVISVAGREKMWSMGERIAETETSDGVLTSYLNHSLLRFSHAEPERCEAILAMVRRRLAEFASSGGAQNRIQESLGNWVAQLFAGQGRPLLGDWLREWAADPEENGDVLNSYCSSLRSAFFGRYAPDAETGDRDMCDRAQSGMETILAPAIRLSSGAQWVFRSDATEDEKEAAGRAYKAAERVIHHAMNQLYFGSGAHADDRDGGLSLADDDAKGRFLTDYAEILALLRQSHEPATLHHLIELYEFLIPGDPVAVFIAIHSVLLGRGAEEGYQFESLGTTAVVKVVKRYIADHRDVFEDPRHREMLVEILQLFAEVGWTDALKLLYDLPDLLR
jgi:hypothetical protein